MAKRIIETPFTDGFGELRKLEITLGGSMAYPGRHYFEEIHGFHVSAIDGNDEFNYMFHKDEVLRIQSYLQRIGAL